MTCADCTFISERTCRVCGHSLTTVLCLGNQSPANAYHRPGTPKAEAFPLHRAVCTACGVEQVISRPDVSDLYADYRYLSGANPRWVTHVETLAAKVTRERAGKAGTVIDIGSNDGTLLKAYKDIGWDVWGVEPCKELAEDATHRGIPTINAFLGSALTHSLYGTADIVHAHNVWGHFTDPIAAACQMRQFLKSDGQIIIETPWLVDTVRGAEFDTLYHEHAHTWSLGATEHALKRADRGLRVLRAEVLPIHGGSLRMWVGMHGKPRVSVAEVRRAEAEVLRSDWPSSFAARTRALVAGIDAWLRSANAAGISVALYGAAAKATVLLHALTPEAREAIGFVVDDAPAKQGLCMPGTDLMILEPDRLMLEKPDAVLVTAWNWAESIAAGGAADYLADGGLLVVPDPSSPTAVRVIGGS